VSQQSTSSVWVHPFFGPQALVVPAFEAMPADPLGDKASSSNLKDPQTFEYPEDKAELLAQEKKGFVEPFQ
jgi:hypothetical protein